MLWDPGEELCTLEGGLDSVLADCVPTLALTLTLTGPDSDCHSRLSFPSLTTNTFSIPPRTVTSSR